MAAAQIRHRLGELDLAAYRRLAEMPAHPQLDRSMALLSRAANRSRLSIAIAGLLAASGGPQGRRAALAGLASVGATSALVNLGLKPLGRRERPDRAGSAVPVERHVPVPASTSFPSGHAASAFAFANGVSVGRPALAAPLTLLAAAVAYSRVHTGVHYPVDVVVGAAVGTVVGQVVGRVLLR